MKFGILQAPPLLQLPDVLFEVLLAKFAYGDLLNLIAVGNKALTSNIFRHCPTWDVGWGRFPPEALKSVTLQMKGLRCLKFFGEPLLYDVIWNVIWPSFFPPQEGAELDSTSSLHKTAASNLTEIVMPIICAKFDFSHFIVLQSLTVLAISPSPNLKLPVNLQYLKAGVSADLVPLCALLREQCPYLVEVHLTGGTDNYESPDDVFLNPVQPMCTVTKCSLIWANGMNQTHVQWLNNMFPCLEYLSISVRFTDLWSLRELEKCNIGNPLSKTGVLDFSGFVRVHEFKLEASAAIYPPRTTKLTMREWTRLATLPEFPPLLKSLYVTEYLPISESRLRGHEYFPRIYNRLPVTCTRLVKLVENRTGTHIHQCRCTETIRIADPKTGALGDWICMCAAFVSRPPDDGNSNTNLLQQDAIYRHYECLRGHVIEWPAIFQKTLDRDYRFWKLQQMAASGDLVQLRSWMHRSQSDILLSNNVLHPDAALAIGRVGEYADVLTTNIVSRRTCVWVQIIFQLVGQMAMKTDYSKNLAFLGMLHAILDVGFQKSEPRQNRARLGSLFHNISNVMAVMILGCKYGCIGQDEEDEVKSGRKLYNTIVGGIDELNPSLNFGETTRAVSRMPDNLIKISTVIVRAIRSNAAMDRFNCILNKHLSFQYTAIETASCLRTMYEYEYDSKLA